MKAETKRTGGIPGGKKKGGGKKPFGVPVINTKGELPDNAITTVRGKQEKRPILTTTTKKALHLKMR